MSIIVNRGLEVLKTFLFVGTKVGRSLLFIQANLPGFKHEVTEV